MRLLVALLEWTTLAFITLSSMPASVFADPPDISERDRDYRTTLKSRVEKFENDVSVQLDWNQSAFNAIQRLNEKIQRIQEQLNRTPSQQLDIDQTIRSDLASLRSELQRIQRVAADAQRRAYELERAKGREVASDKQKSKQIQLPTGNATSSPMPSKLASFTRPPTAALLNPSAAAWKSSDGRSFLSRERDGRLLLSAVSEIDDRASEFICTLDSKDNKNWSGYTYRFPIDGFSKETVAADLVIKKQSDTQATLTIHFMETRLFRPAEMRRQEFVLTRE